MDNINKLCRAIANLKESDFIIEEGKAEEQANYSHPLKMATASKVNAAGVRNLKILKSLRELKELIEQGKPKK